jgi:hypothetical protein
MINLNKVNLIELKKNKHYLFVFDRRAGLDRKSARNFLNLLHERGFEGIGLILEELDGMKIIEKNEMSNLSKKKSSKN